MLERRQSKIEPLDGRSTRAEVRFGGHTLFGSGAGGEPVEVDDMRA
jgi:hypothetical protein